MKVILKDTNEVKNVSFGYAVNYLLPRDLAEIATPEKIKALEEKKKKEEKDKKLKVKEDKSLVDKLKNKKVVIRAKVGKGKKLFGGVTKKNILKALAEDEKKVEVVLDKPIKKLGKKKIELKVGSKRVSINLEVVKKDET